MMMILPYLQFMVQTKQSLNLLNIQITSFILYYLWLLREKNESFNAFKINEPSVLISMVMSKPYLFL